VHIQSNITQQEKMLYLKGKLKQLNQIIGSKKICYLDLPMHHNFGDLLIMLGTLDFFKCNNYAANHCCTIFNFFAQAIQHDDVIIFQGGGNFGDLHPAHQIHRENIIVQYPNHKIVILPQTVFFKKEKEFDKTCKVLSKHKNLHICVRDHHSFLLAKNMTPNVYLLPDMAHQLYPMQSPNQEITNTNKTLYIKRTDVESSSDNLSIKADCIVDWYEMLGKSNYLILLNRRLQQISSFLSLNQCTANITSNIWIKYVNNILKINIINKIEEFDLIYTSRLHGFIFANLLNKDVDLIDNSYSKNKQYFNTWFS
jgi:pyruvyl transferase EpsO